MEFEGERVELNLARSMRDGVLCTDRTSSVISLKSSESCGRSRHRLIPVLLVLCRDLGHQVGSCRLLYSWCAEAEKVRG